MNSFNFLFIDLFDGNNNNKNNVLTTLYNMHQ